MLRKVFENPRVHSNIGYAMKKVGVKIWTFSLSEENIIYCYPLGNQEKTREFCKSSTFQSKGHFQALRMENHEGIQGCKLQLNISDCLIICEDNLDLYFSYLFSRTFPRTTMCQEFKCGSGIINLHSIVQNYIIVHFQELELQESNPWVMLAKNISRILEHSQIWK